MKIYSWNVNGIRAAITKGLEEKISEWEADIICFQETKAQEEQVKTALKNLEAYNVYSCVADKKGYSGVTTITRIKPLSVSTGINLPHHDSEGRVLTLEFEDFYLVNVYVPNSGDGLKRLGYRAEWDQCFKIFLESLHNRKPIVVTGDFNVAHHGIDLKNDKANYNKTSGYTQVEIDGLDAILSIGLIDTFRHFYPNTEKYTFWSTRMNAREKNLGWRIDYFLVSNTLLGKVQKSEILDEIFGSDHCPIFLEM